MEKPYIFDGIIYSSNKRSRTPSPTFKQILRFLRFFCHPFVIL